MIGFAMPTPTKSRKTVKIMVNSRRRFVDDGAGDALAGVMLKGNGYLRA